MGIYSHLLLFF
jgi:hypothetical protein